MPMVSYQTCLPVKLTNATTASHTTQIRSIRMRVNAVIQPLYVNATDTGLGLCSSVTTYTLVTEPMRLADIFLNNTRFPVFTGLASTVYIQFPTGLSSNGYTFPNIGTGSSATNNLVLLGQSAPISAFSDIIKKIQIYVPEAFIGKSVAEISSSNIPGPVLPKKKAFKCYTIDPKKDIVGDQIMVDPTTGQSLADTMADQASSGEYGYSKTTYYTLYGDDIIGTLTVSQTISLPGALNVGDLTAFVAQDGSRIRIAFASLTNPYTTVKSIYFNGNISNLTVVSNKSIDNSWSFTINNGGPRNIDSSAITDDTGFVNINPVTITAAGSSSGILPGDIERILIIIGIAIVSLILFAYLAFIAQKIYYKTDEEYFPIMHIVIFCVLVAGLTLVSLYLEKGTDSIDPNKNGVAPVKK